jgi:hypothetical protein
LDPGSTDEPDNEKRSGPIPMLACTLCAILF